MATNVFPIASPLLNWSGIQFFYKQYPDNENPTRLLDQKGYELSDPLSFIPAVSGMLPLDVSKKHLMFSFLIFLPDLLLDEFRFNFPDLLISVLPYDAIGHKLILVTTSFYTWESIFTNNKISKHLLKYTLELKAIFEATCYKRWRSNVK